MGISLPGVLIKRLKDLNLINCSKFEPWKGDLKLIMEKPLRKSTYGSVVIILKVKSGIF